MELGQGRVRLGVRERFLTDWVVGCWNKVPREMVMAPSLSEFKNCLDTTLSYMV